jgi:hypothetical protein
MRQAGELYIDPAYQSISHANIQRRHAFPFAFNTLEKPQRAAIARWKEDDADDDPRL